MIVRPTKKKQEKSKAYYFIWILNLETYQEFQNNYMKRHLNSSICGHEYKVHVWMTVDNTSKRR